MAVNRTILSRYCAALLSAAEESGEVLAVQEALERIARAAKTEPRFLALLSHPRLSAEERAALIVAGAGRAPGLIRGFANLVARRGRVSLLPFAAAEYRRLSDESAGMVRVGVETFAPLADESVESLKRRLSELVEGEISMELTTNPALLGGVRLRIGDRVVDGSLSARLAAIRAELAAGAS